MTVFLLLIFLFEHIMFLTVDDIYLHVVSVFLIMKAKRQLEKGISICVNQCLQALKFPCKDIFQEPQELCSALHVKTQWVDGGICCLISKWLLFFRYFPWEQYFQERFTSYCGYVKDSDCLKQLLTEYERHSISKFRCVKSSRKNFGQAVSIGNKLRDNL